MSKKIEKDDLAVLKASRKNIYVSDLELWERAQSKYPEKSMSAIIDMALRRLLKVDEKIKDLEPGVYRVE